MPRPRRAGLTIVETTLVISVVGIIAAVFIPTFLRTVRTSKITEAADLLSELYARTNVYYAARHTSADGRVEHCLPAAAGPAPAAPRADAERTDFQKDGFPGAATWKALDFAPTIPVRYSYSFLPKVVGCGEHPSDGPTVVLRAEGDLDGDGVHSVFERASRADESGRLVPEGVLAVVDRLE